MSDFWGKKCTKFDFAPPQTPFGELTVVLPLTS